MFQISAFPPEAVMTPSTDLANQQPGHSPFDGAPMGGEVKRGHGGQTDRHHGGRTDGQRHHGEQPDQPSSGSSSVMREFDSDDQGYNTLHDNHNTADKHAAAAAAAELDVGEIDLSDGTINLDHNVSSSVMI